MIWAAVKAIFAKPIWRAIGGALGRVPWQVWAAVVLAGAFWWHGNASRADERAKIKAVAAERQVAAMQRSIEAAEKANAVGAIRELETANQQQAAIEAIEAAEAAGGNALDALFGN